jgi:hypothetical protein
LRNTTQAAAQASKVGIIPALKRKIASIAAAEPNGRLVALLRGSALVELMFRTGLEEKERPAGIGGSEAVPV